MDEVPKVVLTKQDLNFVNKLINGAKKVFKHNQNIFTKKEVMFIMNEWKKEFREHDIKKTPNKTKQRLYRQFVAYALQRNLANYDTMILLTGSKGTGKSSAAIQFARSWCQLIGIRFKPERHIAYNNSDVMDRCDTLNKFEPLIADEAIRFASSEDWNKAENKELKKKLGQIRTKHLFYILCFPLKPAKLEKTYLESYTNYWLDLYARGEGALFVPDKNPSKEAWNLKAFDKMGSWNEFSTSAEIEVKMKNHPNFWKILKIPVVPKEIYDNYLGVRESNVYSDKAVSNTVTKVDLNKSALILMLKEIVTKDGSLTYDRILKSMEVILKIQMNKKELQYIINDSQQMVEAMR